MAKPLGPIWLSGLISGALSVSVCVSVPVSAQDSGADRLQRLSDSQLTSLAADWDELSDKQRSQLIQETRQRMQPQTSSPVSATKAQTPEAPQTLPQALPQALATSKLPAQTIQRRRYGALVRQADGTVRSVQVETQVIRVQGPDPQRAYGTGFEQRRNRNLRGRPNTRVTPVNSVSANSISNNVLSEVVSQEEVVSRQD